MPSSICKSNSAISAIRRSRRLPEAFSTAAAAAFSHESASCRRARSPCTRSQRRRLSFSCHKPVPTVAPAPSPVKPLISAAGTRVRCPAPPRDEIHDNGSLRRRTPVRHSSSDRGGRSRWAGPAKTRSPKEASSSGSLRNHLPLPPRDSTGTVRPPRTVVKRGNQVVLATTCCTKTRRIRHCRANHGGITGDKSPKKPNAKKPAKSLKVEASRQAAQRPVEKDTRWSLTPTTTWSSVPRRSSPLRSVALGAMVTWFTRGASGCRDGRASGGTLAGCWARVVCPVVAGRRPSAGPRLGAGPR